MPNDELNGEAITAAVREYQRQGGPCHICGMSTMNVGVFCANQKFGARIGAPKGKARNVLYRICEDCHRLPNWMELIEAGILRDCQVQ
jgi:hypothetical protein